MSEKQYSSVRDYAAETTLKQKICGISGSFATKEILFDVQGNISVVERYCEKCSQDVVKENKKHIRYLYWIYFI